MIEGRAPGGRTRGFTLTELLTVIGLIALLAALFLPVVGRVRAAASAAGCLSNLKQMGTAWTASLGEGHNRLPEYTWHLPFDPDATWKGYWTAMMDGSKAGGRLLCPSAPDANPSDATGGYGTATLAWNGQFGSNGTAIRRDDRKYRQSSYGYNRYLTAGGGFTPGRGAVYLGDLAKPGNVPVFIDCAYADVWPTSGRADNRVDPPPSLSGEHAAPGKPEHWKILLSRHGRGVNVYRADGSAAWVRLEELYLLNWRSEWTPHRLTLPRN